MIIGSIFVIALLLILAGYWLFTQQRCYVHHTTPIHCNAETLFTNILELDRWSQWLPWTLYDDSSSLNVNQHSVNHLDHSVVQIKGTHLGLLSCHIKACQINQAITFEVVSDSNFPCPISIKLELSANREGQLELHAIGDCELSFWHRLQHDRLLSHLYADVHLMMVRLKAVSEVDSSDALNIEYLAVAELPNIDAVTRPFIVSDQPMSQKMEQGFKDLIMTLGPENQPAGPRFALYEAADPKRHYFTGKLGVTIQGLSPCEAEPERLCFKGRYIGLKYQGSYQHLWLAWHILQCYSELQGNKRAHQRNSVEMYTVSPRDTETETELTTLLYLPIQ